jgi:hypothetical protein
MCIDCEPVKVEARRGNGEICLFSRGDPFERRNDVDDDDACPGASEAKTRKCDESTRGEKLCAALIEVDILLVRLSRCSSIKEG